MKIFINIYISEKAKDIAPEAFRSKEAAIAEAKNWLAEELRKEHEDIEVIEEETLGFWIAFTYVGTGEPDSPYVRIFERGVKE
jgi:hypothetical protein